MTGKELKDWAATIPDDATILGQSRGDWKFQDDFKLQASLIIEWPANTEEETPT